MDDTEVQRGTKSRGDDDQESGQEGLFSRRGRVEGLSEDNRAVFLVRIGERSKGKRI